MREQNQRPREVPPMANTFKHHSLSYANSQIEQNTLAATQMAEIKFKQKPPTPTQSQIPMAVTHFL